MAIRRSSAAEVEALVAALGGPSDVARDAAVARLAILADRAAERLLRAVADPPSPRAHAALLQALEGAGDARALDPALDALASPDPDVSAAAVSVLRSLIRADSGPRALDRVIALAVDAARPAPARLLAIEALSEIPPRVIAPILKRLADDANPDIRARVSHIPRLPSAPPPAADLERHAESRLPANPRRLRSMVLSDGADAPLAALYRLVEAVRARETVERDERRREAWTAVRGLIHETLAARGSTVALHDLRETLERAERPLAPEFLSALAQVGDLTCLEPIVMAFARSTGSTLGPEGGWWRERLGDAFRQIVRRERLTGRHGAIRRIRARWPAAAEELLGPKGRSRR